MSDLPYKPDDFIYVDPDAKAVVGLVEWDKDGNALPKEWPYPPRPNEKEAPKGKPFRKPKKRYYPWGSFKTMSKMYKLQGKVKDKDTEDYITLDTAIGNLQKDPFWD